VKFKILTAVLLKIQVLYHCQKLETCSIHIYEQAFFLAMLDPKSGGIKEFQNIGNCSPMIQYNIPKALIPLQETP